MPLTSAEAVTRALASGKLGGVYFLFGEEEYLKEELATSIVTAHLDPATRDFNLDQVRGTDVTAESLASLIATPPMMAEYRVIVVRDAQALATAAKNKAVIEAVLERTPPGLALILVATLPDKAKAQIYERLKKQAVSVAFPLLNDADVPGWLMVRAHSDGFELQPKAAQAMASAMGAELGVLLQELKKLYEFTAERKLIKLADVQQVVGSVPRQNRWEWFDMLGERRFAAARAALHVLLDSGETGVGLIIGMGSHFLRLGILASGGEKALESALPAHQKWLAGRLGRQARRWKPQQLDSALDDLLRADRLLKSSNLGDVAVLDEFILRLEAQDHAA
ncbi:MAG TPA: DNA polymerase III subunit delta [Longimicrobiales bacterium]|nr:DNA polymerase III subunit delta [Longimicrobiales bacterium]